MTSVTPTQDAAFTTAAHWNDFWAKTTENAPPTVRSDDDISVATMPHPIRGQIPVVSVRCYLPKRIDRDALVRNERVERALACRVGASALAVTPGSRKDVILIRFVPGEAT